MTIKVRKLQFCTSGSHRLRGGHPDGLDAFASEADAEAGRRPAPAPGGLHTAPRKGLVLAGGALALILGAAAAGSWPLAAVLTAPSAGSVTIRSMPAGAEVIIDGAARGHAPLTLTLPVGTHNVELRSEAGTRALAVEVEGGQSVEHHVDVFAPAPLAGTLRVSTEPEGLIVAVDGVEQGPAPIEIEGLAPGIREVQVAVGGQTVRRQVPVAAGTASAVLVVAVAAAAPPSGRPTTESAATGWVSLTAPFPLAASVGGKMLSVSQGRISLPAGRHDIDLANAELGYRERLSISVQSGATVNVRLEAPTALLSVNALPWADVLIDGKPVGQTPLANVPVPIGRREVLFRHPTYGDRRHSIIVTLVEPARLSVEMLVK